MTKEQQSLTKVDNTEAGIGSSLMSFPLALPIFAASIIGNKAVLCCCIYIPLISKKHQDFRDF